MRDVVVVGAGGHARVCIEVLQATGHRVVGCVARDLPSDTVLAGLYLGSDDRLEALVETGETAFFIAVGDNAHRLALAERVRQAGGELLSAISPHAVVSPSAFIGPGTLLMPGAVVNAGTVLGAAVVVNTNASVDHDCTVGAGVHVAPGSAVAGGVVLGEGAFLGIGSCVVPGVSVGPWAVVGAGAAVVGDVAAGTTVTGVPARLHRSGGSDGRALGEDSGSGGPASC